MTFPLFWELDSKKQEGGGIHPVRVCVCVLKLKDLNSVEFFEDTFY